MSKTKNSINSLLLLLGSKKIEAKYVTLLQLYVILNKTKFNRVASLFYRIFKTTMTKNLVSKNPSLLIYNLFRVTYMCSIKQ